MSFFPAICDFFGAPDFFSAAHGSKKADQQKDCPGPRKSEQKGLGIEVLSSQKLNYQVTGTMVFYRSGASKISPYVVMRPSYIEAM